MYFKSSFFLRFIPALLAVLFVTLMVRADDNDDDRDGVPPSITSQPLSEAVAMGQAATFSVTAKSTTPLTYRWKKNGETINGATSASYTTPPVEASDNGAEFYVVVRNSAGRVVSSTATLTVSSAAVAPSITTQPVNQTVTMGQAATFTVVATGTAPLSYQWQKNGTAISGATSASYTTAATTSADNGAKFLVVVSNSAGSATSNAATLTVNAAAVAPSITTQPSNQTVTVGQTATFTVVATGTAPLSYQWQKNGTAISGATSASYTTPATTSADNGAKFLVVVSNSAGNVTSNAATLTVNAAAVAPSITAQPANQTVTVGQAATFTVVATGTAPLSYQWQKNGTAISGATSASYTTAATTSADNGAKFLVVVSNSAGSATSNAATLTVNAAAPSITTQPSNQTVTVGQTATFTVVATGTAPLRYQWQKNGTAISGATSASYTTAATTSADNGAKFLVVVSNSAGSATSNAATLTVNASSTAPSITTQPSNQTVTVGQTATFTVVATGTAPLSYQWQKNGTAISGATSASYTTPATTSADNSAQFVVVVSNSAGSVTSNAATLTVNASSTAPAITTQPSNQTVTVGQTATFTVVATGTAPLSYQWQKNGTAISGATSASYTTPATTSTDNGAQFVVVVSNVAGNVTSNAATLTVNAAGTMPQFGHVFIVIGENSAYSSTYNSSNMPYLTSLANQYGLSTKYWADTHPSIGNYEVLTAGQIFTNNDSATPSSMPLSGDNIAFEVQQAGKTWKDYVESGMGCGALNSGTYYVRHDPLQYFTNINTEKANFVCFSQFATDLANKTLPNLSWLSPNGTDDGHDTSASAFDSWLQTVITPLLASSYFQPGGDGLLIITWDENDKSGTPNCGTTTVGQGCGGQVETVLISPVGRLAYKSTAGDPANYNNTYDHASILRTIGEALGLTNFSGLGGAASRVPMADFF